MIKISVIIPFYNVEKYFTQCLDSVIRQTLQEIEILCIDDKSPDKSIEIAREFSKKDCRIRIIQHEHNAGVGAARNTGIKCAKGDYIFFLDSDDWLLEEGLQKLYEAAQHFNVPIVSAPFQRYQEPTNSYMRTRIKKKGILTLTNKKFDSLDYNAFKLFHTSIFNDPDIRFPDRLIHEDVEFYCKVFTNHKRLYCLTTPTMVYRIRSDSIMTSKKTNNYCENNIQLIKNIFLFLQKKNILETYREAFTKEYYHFYFMGSTFDTERYSQELEPFFRKNNFTLSFSIKKIRKWFFHKQFNKNEQTLKIMGCYLIKNKL